MRHWLLGRSSLAHNHMKKLIILSLLTLAFSIFGQVPPPVLRNMFSTNAPGTTVLGRFELNTRSNEALLILNTNWMVISNGNIGIGVFPTMLFQVQGNLTNLNNPSGNGINSTRWIDLTSENGGDGSASGGNAGSGQTAINLFRGGNGGIGTNGNGGGGAGVGIVAGNGGAANLTAGRGGHLDFNSGNGGFGTNFGGNGGRIQFASGKGGASVTNAGRSGGDFSATGGDGGSSVLSSGGAASVVAFLSGNGGVGNLTGGKSGDLTFSVGTGGRGTNSGGQSGIISFQGGLGGNTTTNTGGHGGPIIFTGGNGGDSVLGYGGNASNINFTAGNGGAGVTNGDGGSIFLKPGTGRTNGNVYLGINSAGSASGNVFVFASTNFNTTNAAPIITNVPSGPTPTGLFGQMVFFGATNALALSGATTDYTNFNSFFRVSTNGFIVNTNTGYLTNIVSGWYRVAYMVDIIPNADNNNDELEVEIFTNSQASEVGASRNTLLTAVEISMSDSTILYLPARTGISLRFRNVSDATSTIDIRHCTVSIGTP